MADSKDSGVARVSRMEKNQHLMGRTGSGTPKMKLRGDANPTKKGGINRATEPRYNR